MARVTLPQAVARRSTSGAIDYRRMVEDVLDGLPLTEREYHHLNFDLPLVADLVERVERHARAGDAVLLIGGGDLLGRVLMTRGFDLSVWRFPRSHLSPEVQAHVDREVTPEALARLEPTPRQYAAIVAPRVIEALPRDEAVFLRALRKSIRADGRVILATLNQSRLAIRLAALTGRRFSLRRAAPPFSFSGPSLPIVHEYHREELAELSLQCGLIPERIDDVVGQRLFREFDLLPLARYAGRKLARLAEARLPNAGDTLVAELARRPGDDCDGLPPEPRVAVVLSARAGGARLSNALDALLRQTFPADRVEIVVLHDGRRGEVTCAIEEHARSAPVRVRSLVASRPEGPSARNLAACATDADLVAHTDDLCEIAPDWIETCVREFDADTAVVSGPVHATAGSHPKYLDTPGVRPDHAWRERPRRDLFPVYNSAHRRDAVAAVGGFDVRFDGRDGPSAGWDTDLAWRLQRQGWQSRYREHLSLGRCFPAPGGFGGQIRSASSLPTMYSSIPEMRRELVLGVFASRETMNFDLLLAGLLVAGLRRDRRPLLLALPFLAQVGRRFGLRPSRWRPSARMTLRVGAAHAAWCLGLVRGSLAARRPVL